MLRDIDIWLPGYLRRSLTRRRPPSGSAVLFCIADHFEPAQSPGDPPELRLERVERWIEGYERSCAGGADSRGRAPQRTYFFPEEQYDGGLLEPLAGHCRGGFGEVEVHIHHDGDTPEEFVEKIETFKGRLESHGLLTRRRGDGRLMYGFVHGNWALDNSLSSGRWCGLNNEITLLGDTGCYADFTMPSAPAGGQTRKVNSIYFADDDPERPKSHDTGRDLVFGGKDSGDLLLIQGPLALNWRSRKLGLLPRIENGDISAFNPPSEDRARLWIRQGISVAGREEIVFVKVHAHGLKRGSFEMFTGPEGRRLFESIESACFDEGMRLYYVSAREMANAALALNEGTGDAVEDLFDCILEKPPAGP